MDPPENSVVLDACAAPGNKTTQLGMYMKNTGVLMAIERDKRRFKVLSAMIEKAGVSNAHLLNEDFLKINPNEEPFSKVLSQQPCMARIF